LRRQQRQYLADYRQNGDCGGLKVITPFAGRFDRIAVIQWAAVHPVPVGEDRAGTAGPTTIGKARSV